MDNKKHIYFMPGMAASTKIFEYIKLPIDQFEFHFLDWLTPETIDESLENYTKRLCDKIEHDTPILIGVSFGGIIVQEMSKIIKVQKIIIISSVKNYDEVPKRMKFARFTRIYKLIPTKKISATKSFSKLGFNEKFKKKSELYNKYLHIINEDYLKWSIINILNWHSTNPIDNLVHIHGSADEIFPIKHINNCRIIDGGTHAMIITKAKKINTILLEIL